MLKHWLTAALAALAFSAQAATLHSAQGDVEITQVPQRIAVYDIGVLDSLVALGLGDKIVAVPNDTYTAQFELAQAKKVGTLFEPDLEALNAAQPDLVIVAVRSAGKLDDVKKVANAVDLTLKGENLYQEGLARLANLGEVFDKKEQAQALVDELNALRDEVKPLAAGKGKVLSILVNGPKIALYGPSSRAGWLAAELDLNLVQNEKMVGRHGEPVSFEYIAAENPDWIIALDRLASIGEAGDSAKQTLDNELVHGTTAWKNGHIIYPDTRNLYINIGGPSGLKGTLNELKAAFSQ